jgi:hypothetical protein
VQEISSWTADTLNTPEDISAQIVGGTTTYGLRKAATVADVFGATNSAGLTPSPDGDLTNADKVLILNAGGSFDTVFYFNDGAGTEGWFDDAFGPAANAVIAYPDAFFVQRAAGSPIDVVISGEVKLVDTSSMLVSGYNYVGVVAPAGLTLGAAGIEAFITPSADGDLTNADTVLLPLPDGSYKTTFYFNDGAGTTGWYDDAFGPAGADVMPSAVLIQNKGAAKPLTVSVPAAYATL